MDRTNLNSLSKVILDAAFVVHKEMGPGLLEAVYEFCMMREFQLRGIMAESQVAVPIFYKGHPLGKEFRIDILVEREIIIEIKAVDLILPVHKAQIISYLKLTGITLGFLINFNVSLLKEGFSRFVCNF